VKIKLNVLSGITLMVVLLTAASTRLAADTGNCGGATTTVPFTDVMNSVFFCEIAEAFFSGLTNGTTPTTYSPSDLTPREQMAAFVTRTMDQSLKRGSRRASLDQYWTPTSLDGIGFTPVSSEPRMVKSDGTDVWVASALQDGSGTVSRVRCSDGKLLETWTGAAFSFGVLVAKGRIFVTGNDNPGKLYQIDPTQTAGVVTTLTSSLGFFPRGIAFDGARVWTANEGVLQPGSVSIVTLNPVSVTTIATGFIAPYGMLYDGSNIWVTDSGDSTLKKLDASGNILQTVSVGNEPRFPAFDGTNIWVPNVNAVTVTVVRAATGTVLATLSGNGMNGPFAAAFDGERIMVTNNGFHAMAAMRPGPVSLWNAASLAPLGSISFGTSSFPRGVCSDGLNFWIALQGTNQLARF
jgi:hypothetical protein